MRGPNIPLLKAVADYILYDPIHYDQDSFFTVESEASAPSVDVCNTTCCIGGTAVLLHDPREYSRIINEPYSPTYCRQSAMEAAARKALNITQTQSIFLFSAHFATTPGDPAPRGSRAHAKMGVKHINAFIRKFAKKRRKK